MSLQVTLSDGTISREITAQVRALRWRIGMRAPYDVMAPPAECEVVLRNADGSASPARDEDGLLDPGTEVSITRLTEIGTQGFFVGRIVAVEPDMGGRGRRQTRLIVRSGDAWLDDVRVRVPVMANVRSDVLLDAVLDVPPLDQLTRSLDTGTQAFAYAGDQWGGGIRAANAVRQIVEAERGRFYITRGGVMRFLARDSLASSPTPDATFDRTAEKMELLHGADVINSVRVHVRPRSLGATGSTLWTLASAQKVRASGSLRLIVPMRDAQGRRAGAISVITPVPVTDYSANTAPDGSGTDVTASLSVTVLALEGSAAKLKFTNASGSPIYVLPDATLRGTPLLGGQPAVIEAADDTSAARYGPRLLEIDAPLIDSLDDADQTAALELARRPEPASNVRTLTLSERVRYDDALALTLFDAIRVIDTHTGIDAVYWIVGEAHEVTRGGARHTVTWTLEPVG